MYENSKSYLSLEEELEIRMEERMNSRKKQNYNDYELIENQTT